MAPHATPALGGEASSSEKAFPFFRLPRELRNSVYGQLTAPVSDSIKLSRRRQYHLSADVFPLQSARMVNKQFQGEYENEIFLAMSLKLETSAAKVAPLEVLRKSRWAPFLAQVQDITFKMGTDELKVVRLGFPGISLNAHAAAANLLDNLSGLQSIRLVVALNLNCFENLLRTKKAHASPTRFYDEELHTSSQVKASMRIQKTMLLANDLYSVNPDVVRDDVIAESLEHALSNTITYRATPSTSINSWHGLDLATETAGAFDYEAAVQEARRISLHEADSDEDEDEDWDPLRDACNARGIDLEWDDDDGDYHYA